MSHTPTADDLIDRHHLQPHPAGGYFSETWRSALTLPAAILPDEDVPRQAGTAIYYLLLSDQLCVRHRLFSDKLWFHLLGDPLTLSLESPRGDLRELTLGPTPDLIFQALAPAHHWQSARPLPGPTGYALMASVAVPGFDFGDFEHFSP
ncbi:cupin [Lujinxingia litoralis]|uniref:Cupin n=1 Tax=Lujinxingia litoralis TaxID=2211119 RepID=A0A328C330_9DELT|nr:cupin domain-containing protein [Lujinxingia litoralis]RAL20197.1 cupin [Lujinxingia litoralis]